MNDGLTRKTFYVDVGKVPPAEAMKLIRKWKKALWQGTKDEQMKVPPFVDRDVYKGVRIGMRAMMEKQKGRMKGTTTVELEIDRYDKRVFTIPAVLDDFQINGALVVLNAAKCRPVVDYALCGSTLNWMSDRKLRETDCLLIRYPLGEDVAFVPSNMTWSWSEGAPVVDYTITTSHEGTVEDVVYANTTPEEPDEIIETYEDIEDLTEEEEILEEEEEMIEPGIKVWHRLTHKGPWIVIQESVLRIRSSQSAGGDENRVHDTHVEKAWTVQTDRNIEDFPEVLLTTREPDVDTKSGCKNLARYVAMGFVVSLVAFGVVNAQWIAQLLGY